MAEQTQNDINKLNLSDRTMEFLGLSQQPFSASILSSHSIFSDATLEQLIDTTKHHLQFSDLLLIIEGDFGSGKTTLFRKLLQNDADNLFLISLPASATFTLTEIQQTISVHLKDQDEAEHLNENLKRLQIFDQTPVLIIDDAHVLADTTIQELLRYQKQLETENDIKLKILMLASKGMAKTIEAISNLQHNQLYVQEMPAYTTSQAHALLSQRLNAVNYQGEDYFNKDKVKTILSKSNGTPLQIMEQAVIQLESITKKQNRPSFSLKRPVILFASLVVIIFISITAYYFMSVENPAEQNNVAAIAVETKPVEENLATTEPLVTDAPFSDHPVEINPTADAELKSDDGPVNTETSISLDDEILKTADIQIHNEEEISATEDNKLKTNENTISSELAPEAEVKADPVEFLETIIEPEKIDIKSKPIIEKIIEKKPEPLDAYLIKLNSSGLHDADWLMQQSSSNWTLQVMGARLPASLYKFAKQHRLNQNSAWFKTELSGKPWYILVYGLYTNKDTARQALQKLPANLKQSKPWIKNIGAIQKSIKP